jgi:hypothetical protein
MKPEAVIEIVNAIEAAKENYPIPESSCRKKPSKWRSPHKQWDRIVCKVCGGCGKRLGRYENTNNLAFCYECREILFPESVKARKSVSEKFKHRRV